MQRPSTPERASDTTAESPWPLRLLTHNIGNYLARMPSLWIEAQIISLTRRPGSGMAFLGLRDTDAEVSMSAMALVSTLDAAGPGIRQGARVVLRVEPRFYSKRGTLSLFVHVARPVGEGELLAQIEQLKRTLSGEGLFDADRKRPLPFLPRSVGVVCGRGSAAERDVVDNARLRWPAVHIELREVAVQGPSAVSQVSAAVSELDRIGGVDVIVITRGGGSTEDLLPFSNEALLRAVAACTTPVVSAIGHEVDTPLLDLVADVRASTPTDAARRIVPDAAHEQAGLSHARSRARQLMQQRIDSERRHLRDIRARPALTDLRSLFVDRHRALAETRDRLRTAMRRGLHRRVEGLQGNVVHLRALSPAGTLQRGYAIVRTRSASGADPQRIVRSAGDAEQGMQLDVTLAEGHLLVAVQQSQPGPDRSTT